MSMTMAPPWSSLEEPALTVCTAVCQACFGRRCSDSKMTVSSQKRTCRHHGQACHYSVISFSLRRVRLNHLRFSAHLAWESEWCLRIFSALTLELSFVSIRGHQWTGKMLTACLLHRGKWDVLPRFLFCFWARKLRKKVKQNKTLFDLFFGEGRPEPALFVGLESQPRVDNHWLQLWAEMAVWTEGIKFPDLLVFLYLNWRVRVHVFKMILLPQIY